MSKANIFNNIKNALKNNNIDASAKKGYGAPYAPSNLDKLERYKELQLINKAEVIDSTKENLESTLGEVLKSLDSVNVLWTQNLDAQKPNGFNCIDYVESVDDCRDELFNADTSVVQAVCGVSNLGIVGLASSIASPRLASLITPKCVILLRKSDVVESIPEAINVMKTKGLNGFIPTNMLFVAGPSRTADIELQTVFGVHGPQKVSIIWY